MDPVTAFMQLANTLARIVEKVIDGQPPEVKKQLWEWYVADIARWRKLLKLDV